MKALLELVDQLLYLMEEHDLPDAMETAQQTELKGVLEGMAREAVTLAGAIRQDLSAREADAKEAQRREELLQRALEAIAKGYYQDAESTLESALLEFPDHHEYYNHLGLVAWERDDMLRAERYYARAAELSLGQMEALELGWSVAQNRGYLRALEGRALSLYRLGRLDEALELFYTLAGTCVPDYQGCYYLAGEIHHMRGELDEAITAYRQSPNEPSVLYNLALAEYQSHDLKASAATFIHAFVSNHFICEALLALPFNNDFDTLEGYLASPSYAEEFIEACACIWERCDDARAFMARCYEDPLVQRQLRDELRLLASPWRGPSTEEVRRVQGLAQRVLDRIFV